MSTMTDTDKLDLARTMFDAWDEMQWDAIAELFAADGVLHSVMQEPVVGRPAIADRLSILGAKAEWLKLHIKTLGIIDGRVFVERVDEFEYDGNHGKIPVVGILSMDGGKVTEWLEYYDRPTLLASMGLDATTDFGH